MKKLTLFFLSLLAFGLGFQACDDGKTYAEMLDEEKDGINDFIKKEGIKSSRRPNFMRRILLPTSRRMSMCSLPAECTCR